MFYCEDDFIYEIHRNSAENNNANFDIRLQSQWNSAVENGYFRYRLNIKHSRILPGKYSFLAQVKNSIFCCRYLPLQNTYISIELRVANFVLSEAN
jgi:GDP-D-glucose phosphorylase